MYVDNLPSCNYEINILLNKKSVRTIVFLFCCDITGKDVNQCGFQIQKYFSFLALSFHESFPCV